jgi:hypothetical protein
MNTQGGCSGKTDWIRIQARNLASGDELLARDLEVALDAAYNRGLRDAEQDCRSVMDRTDARRCCQLTVKACVDEIEKRAA